MQYNGKHKNQILLAKNGLLHPTWSLLSNMSNEKMLSFLVSVMMVMKKLEDVHKRLISGQKTLFLGPKRAALGNQCRETARRAAKRPPTRKPKVFRVKLWGAKKRRQNRRLLRRLYIVNVVLEVSGRQALLLWSFWDATDLCATFVLKVMSISK